MEGVSRCGGCVEGVWMCQSPLLIVGEVQTFTV